MLQGLLYVPDFDAGDPCNRETAEYVPANATRQKNLPPTDYNLIALAPWISANCTKNYLAAARMDPLRAFIFYRPGDSTEQPPPPSSPVWNLNDDNKWKTQNNFPIFAVSGAMGAQMMYELGQYSGNLSTVPHGDAINAIYNPNADDYVRVWTQIAISNPNTLPQIWVFVLIIIGVLLVVITATSFVMHWLASQRRALLRRRVISGEVNLEGMGIKRLTVPMAFIDTFPLFTYHYEPEDHSPPASPTSRKSPRPALASMGDRIDPTDQPASPVPGRTNPASEKEVDSPLVSTIPTNFQPMCAICLEPFQNRVTIIREVPCGHIFHPECIDEFLSECSSLCPLCKACMLPKGYCPRITNAMVRRERALRRIRDRIEVDDLEYEGRRQRMHSWGSSIKQRLFRSSSPNLASTSTELHTPRRPEPKKRRSVRGAGGPAVANGPLVTDSTRERMRQLAGTPPSDYEASASMGKLVPLSLESHRTSESLTDTAVFLARRVRLKLFP